MAFGCKNSEVVNEFAKSRFSKLFLNSHSFFLDFELTILQCYVISEYRKSVYSAQKLAVFYQWLAY